MPNLRLDLKQDLYRIIDQDPRFQALQRSRARFAWSLAGVVFIAYYAFILTIAFNPLRFARRLHDGTVVTVGLVIAATVIVLCLAITGIYIVRANRKFDHLNRSIIEDAERRAAQTSL
ncbi:MAG: DUF485 domain-containing protein [Gammaproteobacteria bacterium]